MEMKGFFEQVAEGVKRELGAGYNCSMNEVSKLNDCTMCGLIIAQEGDNVTPTIYLEPYLQEYNSGRPLNLIVEDIAEAYRRNRPDQDLINRITRNLDHKKLLESVCLKVVGTERNESMLGSVPHVLLEDMNLAVCFYCLISESEEGSMGFWIRNQHLEHWNLSQEELMKHAVDNTNRLIDFEVVSMEETLGFLFGDDVPGETGMYILTDKKTKTFGADAFVLQDSIKEFARQNGCSLYILPSSIHELILLKDNGFMDVEGLQSMVREVNRTQVEPQEVLSDNVFYYNLQEDRLMRA